MDNKIGVTRDKKGVGEYEEHVTRILEIGNKAKEEPR